MKFRLLITTYFCVVSSFFLSSQTDVQAAFVRFNADQGLPNAMIHYTFSDSRGYVWFGTHNGLASWDGFRFKIFKHDRRDSTSISCNIVKFMLEDPDGSIWVGTVGGGLCQFDPVSNQFRRFAPLVISLQTMLVKVTNFSK